jgi:hypothetical protein
LEPPIKSPSRVVVLKVLFAQKVAKRRLKGQYLAVYFTNATAPARVQRRMRIDNLMRHSRLPVPLRSIARRSTARRFMSATGEGGCTDVVLTPGKRSRFYFRNFYRCARGTPRSLPNGPRRRLPRRAAGMRSGPLTPLVGRARFNPDRQHQNYSIDQAPLDRSPPLSPNHQT